MRASYEFRCSIELVRRRAAFVASNMDFANAFSSSMTESAELVDFPSAVRGEASALWFAAVEPGVAAMAVVVVLVTAAVAAPLWRKSDTLDPPPPEDPVVRAVLDMVVGVTVVGAAAAAAADGAAVLRIPRRVLP
jgi:hypothetical protein